MLTEIIMIDNIPALFAEDVPVPAHRRPKKAYPPHPCPAPGCGASVIGREYCNKNCRNAAQAARRKKALQAELPLIARPVPDSRTWAERRKSIRARHGVKLPRDAVIIRAIE